MAALFTYVGTLIHDCFGSYWGLTKAKHALCGPHLLRELTGLVEAGSPRAGQMHTLILGLYQAKLAAKPFSSRHKAWRTYDEICQLADDYEPPPEPRPRGKYKRTKGRNLAERLIKYKTEVLRFALEPNIPFSNNQAERDIRPVKGKQKVAGCFRTVQGAMRYARLQSIFSSWRKQGYSTFIELKAILDGNSFQFMDYLTKIVIME
ncbi:MAG: transposase [Saprospiraceae bacterium]